MIRIACSDSEASCLIASLITEIAMPCPCEGGPLRICGTGPDGAPAEVRILGGGVYCAGTLELSGTTSITGNRAQDAQDNLRLAFLRG